jgi:hypothetical protein
MECIVGGGVYVIEKKSKVATQRVRQVAAARVLELRATWLGFKRSSW